MRIIVLTHCKGYNRDAGPINLSAPSDKVGFELCSLPFFHVRKATGEYS